MQCSVSAALSCLLVSIRRSYSWVSCPIYLQMLGLSSRKTKFECLLYRCTELRGIASSSRKLTEWLWNEFFRDPSQFYDVRNVKKSNRSPDFQHKRTGKALWIEGFYNPLWVRVKLERIELPHVEVNADGAAIIQLLKSFGKKKDISTLRRIHADKGWIVKDIWIANTLISSYAKCGALKEAREVFDQLAERNVESWSALIAGYADQGFGEEALRCFCEMESDGLAPNAVTYACCLKACAVLCSFHVVEKIHMKVRDEGLLAHNTILGTTLINAYAKCGALNEARKVFDQLSKRDVVSWGALIAGYADHGFGEEALKCFRDMKCEGVTANSVIYVCSLKACAIVGALDIVEEIHSHVRDRALLDSNIILGTALISAYAKCGAVREAQKVFDQLTQRNTVSWSALIAGYADQGFGEEALTCFWKMKRDEVNPDSVIYACSLKACAIVGALDIVETIHAQVREEGLLKDNNVLSTALVNAYAKCGALNEAQRVFDQLIDRNVVSWSTLISGYADQEFGEEALICFREMKRDGVTPNIVTYSCILKACADVGSINIVEEIHAKVREEGLLKKDCILGTTLIDAYAKCGALKEAQEVFDQLSEPNVESWSALLSGYAQFGRLNEMLALFNRMRSTDVSPNLVTFLVLLNGCSHGALLDEGQRLFNMITTSGLVPTPEHYTCMVDLFSRAGQFDRAKSFLLDHTSTLLTFLGACQKWVDVDLGVWAFHELLQLDEKCTGAYVFMANIYATAGISKGAEMNLNFSE